MENIKQRLGLIKSRIVDFSPIQHIADYRSLQKSELLEQRLKTTILKQDEPKETSTSKYQRTEKMLSEFHVGELMDYFGIIARIKEIHTYPNNDQPEHPIYFINCIYVEGELSVFKGLHQGSKPNKDGEYTFQIHGVAPQLLEQIKMEKNNLIVQH